MRLADQGDAGLRERLTGFVRYPREDLRGDEKGGARAELAAAAQGKPASPVLAELLGTPAGSPARG